MNKNISIIAMAALLGGCASNTTVNAPEARDITKLSQSDRQAARGDTRGHRARPMTADRLATVLAKYNSDADKQLNWAEFNEWRRTQFDRTDQGNNGLVDKEEYVYEFEDRLDAGYEEAREYELSQSGTQFANLDLNNDGSIQWSEFEEIGLAVFSKWDQNKDGLINDDDKPESAKGPRNFSSNQSSKQFKNELARSLRMPSDRNWRGLMALYDTDSSDEVEQDDFVAQRRSMFRSPDADRDNQLSMDEFNKDHVSRVDTQIDSSRRSSIKQTYVRFNALDGDENGEMTFEEYQISGKRIFTRWDKNDDGIISAADVKTSNAEVASKN